MWRSFTELQVFQTFCPKLQTDLQEKGKIMKMTTQNMFKKCDLTSATSCQTKMLKSIIHEIRSSTQDQSAS